MDEFKKRGFRTQIKTAVVSIILFRSFLHAFSGENIDGEAKLAEFTDYPGENLNKIKSAHAEAVKAVEERYHTELRIPEGDLNGKLEGSTTEGTPLTANKDQLKIGVCYRTGFFQRCHG